MPWKKMNKTEFEKMVNHLENNMETCVVKKKEFKTMEEVFAKKWYDFIYWPHRAYYQIKEHTYWKIKDFIQRGRRGYSDRDLWNFDYFLADLISKGINELKKDCFSYPLAFRDEVEWANALTTMSYAFQMEKKAIDGEVFICEEEEIAKFKDEVGKFMKVLTREEVRLYKKGWRLFEEHFSSLND